MTYLKIFGGILFTALLVLIGLVRLGFEIIGASTAPDDFALLKQRMPKVLEWLFTTPWPVPALLMILIAALAAWLLISGTRKAAIEGVADAEGQVGITSDDVKRIAADYIDSQAGSTKPDLSGDEFDSIIDARLGEFVDTKISAKFETHAQAHERDVKLVNLLDRVKEIEKKQEHLVTFIEGGLRGAEDRMGWIGQGFTALGHWEWHKGEFAKLVDRGEGLRSIADNKFSDEEWEEWEKLEKIWRSRIVYWNVVADWYAPNVGESVLAIPDELFYGKWAIEEGNFGKADRVKRYKDAMIILGNLKLVKEHVERGIKSRAFQGVGKHSKIGQATPGIIQLTET